MQNGELLRRGSVEQLCQQVEGRVVEIYVEPEEIDSYKKYGKIVSFMPQKGKILLRLLLQNDEVLPQMKVVFPTLEEVYLDYL